MKTAVPHRREEEASILLTEARAESYRRSDLLVTEPVGAVVRSGSVVFRV